MRHTMMPYELTLAPIFARAASLFATTEIVSRLPDKSIHRTTYGAFDRRTRKLASALRAAGLTKGDRVATLMWNHAQHLEVYFAAPLAGGVLHTLNLRLHPDDLTFIVNHAEDRFFVVDEVLWPLFEKIRGRISADKILFLSPHGAPAPAGTTPYEAFLESGDERAPLAELREEDALGMCYTSGTTGKPKGVVYSHRSIALHSLAVGLADGLALSRRDTVVPVVPMFHANAWGIPFAAVMVGAKPVFPGPHLDAENLLDLFERERVTVAAGVPTIWLGILEALEKNPGRWKLAPGLRMVVGGSAAPESMIRAFDKHGLTVVHAWGMTETAPLATVSRVGPELDTASDDARYAVRAKQGVPAPFIETRAMNEKGLVPCDGVSPGELHTRGAWVAGSYYGAESGDPALAERWSADGWLKTGDVVTIDASGYVKITDRTKDLIKSGGEWVSSVELENALMGHPAVKEACVVAIPHPKWAERPLAALVFKEGAHATDEELRAFLADKVAAWWVPDAFVQVEAIPRTSAGKFLKSELRERFKDFVPPPRPGTGK